MNGRVAKTLRKIGRAKSVDLQAPERQLVQHPSIGTTAINHPASARGLYRQLKRDYYKGTAL